MDEISVYNLDIMNATPPSQSDYAPDHSNIYVNGEKGQKLRKEAPVQQYLH